MMLVIPALLDLVSRLEELKSAEESVDAVGAAILEWVSGSVPGVREVVVTNRLTIIFFFFFKP